MDWPTRLKIALGSAKGLAYLHEDCELLFIIIISSPFFFVYVSKRWCLHKGHPRIIHRDIKSSNILLDFNYEAMVILQCFKTSKMVVWRFLYIINQNVLFLFFQVSDFGLAKLSSDKDTHVSTRVMGTFG